MDCNASGLRTRRPLFSSAPLPIHRMRNKLYRPSLCSKIQYLSIYLSICLSIYLSNLSIYLSNLSIYPIYLSIQSIYLSIQSIYLSIHPSRVSNIYHNLPGRNEGEKHEELQFELRYEQDTSKIRNRCPHNWAMFFWSLSVGLNGKISNIYGD